MPIIRVNGTALYYEERGTGHQTIVLAHGLLWSCRMFDAQVALLKESYRCVAFDFRGLGGFIGLRLGARHPELIRSLILLETSADPEPSEHVAKYRQLTFVARRFGLGLVVDRVMPVMFGRTFLTDPARS